MVYGLFGRCYFSENYYHINDYYFSSLICGYCSFIQMVMSLSFLPVCVKWPDQPVKM